jgi:hypothetical protein
MAGLKDKAIFSYLLQSGSTCQNVLVKYMKKIWPQSVIQLEKEGIF